MRTRTRIVVNALTSWAATLTRAALGLVLVPFLIVRLGTDGYGLVALLSATVTMTTVLDLGVRNALGRHLAEQVARRDVARFNDLASSAFAVFLLAGCLLSAACLFGAPWLAAAFNVPDAHLPEAVLVVRCYGSLGILLSFLNPVFAATLTSQNRFDIVNALNMAMSIVQGLSLFAVLGLTEAGIYGWMAVMLVGEALKLIVGSRLAHRSRPSLRIRLKDCRRDALRSLFSLGRWMYALQITNMVYSRADPLVITSFFGPTGVAIYTPATSVHGVVSPFVSVLSNQLFPVATRAHVTGRIEDLQAVLIRGTRYTLLMGIPFCVLLGLFATPIMQLWLEDSLGPEYRTTAMVLVGWAIFQLLKYASSTQYPVLLGMNRLRFVVLTELPVALGNLLLSIWLVGYTDLGVVGAVVATVVAAALRFPFIAVYTARCCALPLQRFFADAYLRPLLVLAGVAATGIAARYLLPLEGVTLLAAAVASLGTVWAVLCWWVGFIDQDRRAFAEMFGRMLDMALRVRPTASAVGPLSRWKPDRPD
jgi:O-antigen/teichoic acid export membrane protein